ncbi:MAG: 1-(5-phosphoribosyl)-5-amino-4-imidazole-carboxylate carboxylase, partial [Planctomycetota bacterium]
MDPSLDTRPDLSTAALTEILTSVQAGELDISEGLERLKHWPLRDLGHTRVDTQRALRCGAAEVVFGAGKTPAELVDIGRAILEHDECLFVTRATPAGAAALIEAFPTAVHHARSNAVTVGLPAEDDGEGHVLVVSAGTSDSAVAEEAALSARVMGARVERLDDVGVAGIHRILSEQERLRRARVLIVVAGMEGALPSVVGGLVDR